MGIPNVLSVCMRLNFWKREKRKEENSRSIRQGRGDIWRGCFQTRVLSSGTWLGVAHHHWPRVAWLAEHVYDVWAAWRMKITGREELEVIFRKRRLAKMDGSNLCDINDKCKIEKN